MNHFIEICVKCGAVISQCRCMACDKIKKEGICPKCLEKQNREKDEIDLNIRE